MHRPVQRWLLAAVLVGAAALAGAAQSPMPGANKKADIRKTEPEKSPEQPKTKDKDAGKAPVDKWKLPPGSVFIIPKDFEKGLPIGPGLAIVPLDELMKLREAADKRAAKADATRASVCEMSARLEGNYVALRAEFTFSTETPKTTVHLGLSGAQLTEKADLDGQVPVLGFSDEDGFSVRVDEPAAQHRLVLSFRVPVVSKQPAGGSGLDRAFELGLPGTVTTPFWLELPGAVKEVRWNEVLEKRKLQGKWFFALGKKQSLTVSWREPVIHAGTGPQIGVDGKIKVSLVGGEAEISADLLLEDPRGQAKEVQLIVPPQADVKVDAPAGVAYELIVPGPKNPTHVLRFLEPNAEQWKVSVFQRMPRPMPGGKLAVGPFYVVGADHQQGTITIVAPPESLYRQRLIYHRHGEVFQRDPPKTPDVEAVFQYWLPSAGKARPGGPGRVPLEIEVRSERGPLEAALEHILKLRQGSDRWEIDYTARLLVRPPVGVGDFIDLQIPQPPPIAAAILAQSPGAPYPVAVPWSALALLQTPPAWWAVPERFQVSDESGTLLELGAPDSQGRSRITLPRGLGKGLTLTITGRYTARGDVDRTRVGLPRLLGLNEEGSKLTIQSDPALELLAGPAGHEAPVPDRQRYQLSLAETPAYLDLSWRAFKPDIPAKVDVEVVLHGRTARVRERLAIEAPQSASSTQPAQGVRFELHVPDTVRGLTQVQGDKRLDLRPNKGSVWVAPQEEGAREVLLEYDLPLVDAAGPDPHGPRRLEVALLWPLRATRHRALLRVWCEPGSRLEVVDAPGQAQWADRGVQPVAGHPVLPSLVLESEAALTPLCLQVDDARGLSVAAFVCDRALIEVVIGEDDSLVCRARYLLGKVNADAVEVEFPARVGMCQIETRLGDHPVAWQQVPGNEQAARIPLPTAAGASPLVLEIRYRLSRSTQEQRQFGLATLTPPSFRDPVRIGQLRWQVSLPTGDALALPLNAGARPDYHWGWRRYMWAPEPALTSADLESWLLGSGAAGDARPIHLSFLASGHEPQRVVHLPRRLWIVVVSSAVVALFLGMYLLRLSRVATMFAAVVLVLAMLVLGAVWPMWLPVSVYGAQPGLLVAGVVLLVVWLCQEHYRRQLVFIPAFTRVKSGSSLVRTGKSSKQPREASTIDSPPRLVAGPGSASSKK
jgi:hypothetical protein